ncbi:zinc-binding dehydrogenase [Ophiocordyceps sinensis CO18]|uniref:Zinc-binding dehydrogenase n=1 Tax=Ophiocordyceps sinensis (strain Co18 / CGMCC 3.14243) TaxID=911162 RepID=T5AM34_OPHSC|nr:zinc-binding dehydrogenase [Ophiocordyceps sinensis CO18]
MVPIKSLIFKKIPTGVPVPGEHLAVETRDTDLETPPPGGLIVEVLYASFDPYLRGRMRDPGVKSYVPAFELGQPMTNGTVSRVVKSGSPDFAEGDLVTASTAIAEYARIERAVAPAVNKIRNPHRLPLGLFLGPLGMPGLTAWSGLHRIGRPQKGETIFGLTVIGSVGADDKLDFITKELGFDAGFNYHKEKPLDALRRLAPQGVDIYFENVGGDHLEAALEVMNEGGRIAACGMISEYSIPQSKRKGIQNLMNIVAKQITMQGFINLMNIVAKQITMQGFIVNNPGFGPAHAKEPQEKLQEWLGDGSVKAKLHITDGIDNGPEAFVGMLQGENFGKAVLRVKGESAGSNN